MPTKKKISLPFAFFTALSCCTSCLLCRSHCDTCHSSGSGFKNDSHGPALLIFFRHNVPEQEMTGGGKTGNRIAELLVCLFFVFLHLRCVLVCLVLSCVCVCVHALKKTLPWMFVHVILQFCHRDLITGLKVFKAAVS